MPVGWEALQERSEVHAAEAEGLRHARGPSEEPRSALAVGTRASIAIDARKVHGVVVSGCANLVDARKETP